MRGKRWSEMGVCLWWMWKENLSRASIVEMMLAGAEVFFAHVLDPSPAFPRQKSPRPLFIGLAFLNKRLLRCPWKANVE